MGLSRKGDIRSCDRPHGAGKLLQNDLAAKRFLDFNGLSIGYIPWMEFFDTDHFLPAFIAYQGHFLCEEQVTLGYTRNLSHAIDCPSSHHERVKKSSFDEERLLSLFAIDLVFQSQYRIMALFFCDDSFETTPF
jgi:hypothetical protein